MKAIPYHRRSLSTGSDSEGPSTTRRPVALQATYMSADGTTTVPTRPVTGLDAYADARDLVRLIQCSRCSLPFSVPVTLPCGHSVCRSCLPPPHRREHISYPNTPERLQGITCPVDGCGVEHPAGDCSVDVCLSKVMESLRAVVADYMSTIQDTDGSPSIPGNWNGLDMLSLNDVTHERARQRLSSYGRLLLTYMMAASGKLDYQANVSDEVLAGNEDEQRPWDLSLLNRLRESTHKELDCQICYNLMHDPVTASCGHTFCRICLCRVLDHSTMCPVCRRNLPIAPSLINQPSNSSLVALLQSLCPDMVLARSLAISQDEHGGVGGLDTSLFVCTLAFPYMPTFLHIFEPRYRLMIRRAVETNRQFGMLMYNGTTVPQGTLRDYGTMLQILNVHMLADGRSLIETRGMYKFRVLEHGMLDGYRVGRIERVEDVSLVEEERLEAEEITAALEAQRAQITPLPTNPANVDTLSTQELMSISLQFINTMRGLSAPWLHERILHSHGDAPTDPALFPYWFASVVPIVEEEKYKLLQTTTVRQRLKTVVQWIRRIENQRWSTGGSCSIL